MTAIKTIAKSKTSVKEILNDYRMVCESREASLLGRKEVFMGKAKFGIFGDGKELAQIAMAKVFSHHLENSNSITYCQKIIIVPHLLLTMGQKYHKPTASKLL